MRVRITAQKPGVYALETLPIGELAHRLAELTGQGFVILAVAELA